MLRVMPAGCSISRSISARKRPRRVTSVATSCAIVMPPPEYSHRAPGVVSLRTAGVFAGGAPSSSCGTVGTGLAERVAGESPHGETGGVREQPAERHLLVFGEAAVRQDATT